MYMKKFRYKRVTAMVMAAVLSICAVFPSGSLVLASGADTEPEEELSLYDQAERTDLQENEIAVAEDIVVAAGYGFDIEESRDGIQYDEDAVKISYYPEKSNFVSDKAGDYDTFYKVEPVSDRKPYLICRVITVREPETKEAVSENQSNGEKDTEDAEDSEAETETDSLSLGELDNFTSGDSMQIMMASMPVLKAAPAKSSGMKVACDGYASYCGKRMGIKYISSSGDYHNRLVYCMDLNKSTTKGEVTAGSNAKVKPQITYCLVNGARKLNGKCHNSKYSADSASADYFITGAAIHVLNGEVKLSYYNNGSSVYKKISALVADAKNYDKSEYDTSGLTKSITYTISPKRSEWKDMGDGLYRSADKFVRTKSGTITNVTYTITGQPSGLTVGEIKTDSSEIEDASDLKKYDICVAQTDASKESSNFYLYCNAEALKKIQDSDSVIKVKAKAYSDEKGGRKWTPTVVSQQKITFLEEFNVVSEEAAVKITSKFKLGKFEVYKTDEFTHKPVAGATYYLYEDSDCTDLLCKLERTKDNGIGASDVETLTQDAYYLKEVREADGYLLDEKIYKVGLEYFTLYDADGKVTQQGKQFPVNETPEKVGVAVAKTDSESGNIVKGAGFAVFSDVGCTQRVSVEGDGKADVPVFYYNEDLDFAASEKFVKNQEKYYVKEVIVPDGYRDDGTVWEVTPDYGEVTQITATNTPIRCDVQAVKLDRETGDKAQGDAKLSGATYGLYAAETIYYPDGRGVVSYQSKDNITSTQGTDFYSTGETANANALLATVKTDDEGKFNFGHLYYGNYYIKEIEASEGYLLDDTIYSVNFKEAENIHQDISVNRKVVETVKKQAFEIIKVSTDGESTETDYVKGAEFTVKLQSDIDKNGWDNAAIYDVLVTDEKGYALSKELPYGTYLVKETKTPDELYKTKDFTIEVTDDSRVPQQWRVFNDAPFKAYIRIVKRDAVTGKTVLLPNITFKIKDTEKDAYVEQKVGNKKVSEFITDETGTVTTPLCLKYGNYAVEEITAPEGYIISKKAYPFQVTKTGAVKVEEDEDGDPVIEVIVEDQPVTGSIAIQKSGEVLKSIQYDTIIDRIMSEISGDNRSVDFLYEEAPLAGAVYQLVTDEDIYTPDHQTGEDGKRVLEVINGVPASEGAVVATLTTDENGKAELTGLPLGKYHLEEVTAPQGYVLCEDVKSFELKYADQNTEVVYENAGFTNNRVKTALSVVKKDSVTELPVAGATYGLYVKEDIANREGEVFVEADSLVDIAMTDENGNAKFESDLPLGNYYVKEIETSAGCLLDETVYDVDFTYKDQRVEVITQTLEVKDTPIIVEVSKTDITSGKELAGAKLEVIDSNGDVYASWTTDGKPYQIEAIPAGDYTLRETFAPYGYLIANEVEFMVEATGDIQKVTMSDERVKGRIEIYKTDSKTKKPIKGVEFELRDQKGKVLAKLTTNKKGYAETELLDIATYKENGDFDKDIPYYVVETKAADGYILDNTRHEVLLQYDDSATENIVYQLKVKNKPEKPRLPQTGGNYHPWLFGLAGGALVAVGVIYSKRRKKKRA